MTEVAIGTIEFDPTKVAKGGFAGILEFQGKLVSHTRIPNKFGAMRTKWGTEIEEVSPDQIQVEYEDVVILRMEEGEEEPDLRDGKFNILLNYAKPGHDKSNALSQWNKGYADTCKAVHDKLPNQTEGETVRMLKQIVTMKIRDRRAGTEEEVEALRWTFAPVGDISQDLEARLKDKITGQVKSAALRNIVNDTALRDNAEYRDAVASGAPIAGMELVDGIYVEV